MYLLNAHRDTAYAIYPMRPRPIKSKGFACFDRGNCVSVKHPVRLATGHIRERRPFLPRHSPSFAEEIDASKSLGKAEVAPPHVRGDTKRHSLRLSQAQRGSCSLWEMHHV